MKKFLSFLRGLVTFLGLIAGLALWAAAPWPVLLGLAALIALWMLLTRSGKQAASVAGVGISTLSQRLGSSSVVVIGIAGVVAVLVAMLSMAEGYQQTLRRTGSEDSVIVLRGASAAEVMSTLDLASINVIEQAPGIARSADG
ncbi:ABC transporter permease, partial [Lysobacter sp. 2RAB21]